ncbi:hypothetical protein Cadr_000016464 [Camelus dromedarius]|uniref:Uncharacterized protein n=1 Tax=Camelus dromedarius TaxID=9838 RepID=A0A5N4EBS2_CAMDR|nr:hypothetical protein Cadr_000016464 [Camelus dromedarius]
MVALLASQLHPLGLALLSHLLSVFLDVCVSLANLLRPWRSKMASLHLLEVACSGAVSSNKADVQMGQEVRRQWVLGRQVREKGGMRGKVRGPPSGLPMTGAVCHRVVVVKAGNWRGWRRRHRAGAGYPGSGHVREQDKGTQRRKPAAPGVRAPVSSPRSEPVPSRTAGKPSWPFKEGGRRWHPHSWPSAETARS